MLLQNRTEQNRTEQNRLNNCSFAKTIMMLVIVFYHCILDVNNNWGTDLGNHTAIGIFRDWLGSFHNYCFVLISGYIFYYIKYEKSRYKEFIPFVENKFKRLVIPFLFVAIVWAIPFNSYIFKVKIFSTVTLNKFLLGIAPSQLWFLLMLFWVFVFFFAVSDFVKKNTKLGIVIVLFLRYVSVLATHFIPNVYRIFDGIGFMTFFYVGFLFRQYDIVDRIKRNWLIGIVLADIVLFIIYEIIKECSSTIIKFINTFGIQLALNIVGCTLAFICLQGFADKLNYSESKVYKYCEKRSMGVYLFHQQIVHLCFYFLAGIINVYLLIPLTFVVSFFVSAFIHDLLYKFKYGRILMGEK